MKNRLLATGPSGSAPGALLMAPPAASAAYSYSGDTTFCEAGRFFQPFQSLKDTNWYTRAAETSAADRTRILAVDGQRPTCSR